jgi:hemolysin D
MTKPAADNSDMAFPGRRRKREHRQGVARPALQPTPARPAPARAARMRADDREFLPAAIEILQAPPSRVACGAALAALVWSYFAQVDIYAIAAGKIAPSGRSKVVQPLEPGKVAAVLVKNGSRVQAGDVLVELDPTDSAADEKAREHDLEAAAAEAARRRAGCKIRQAGNPYRVSSFREQANS